MDYETFKEKFTEDLKQNLYERGVGDVDITFQDVEKPNMKYEALTVAPAGSNVGVNFNIQAAFYEYQDRGDYAKLFEECSNGIARGLEDAPVVDVQRLTDYSQMKETLAIDVISADANADLLAKVPHERMEDLAAVYRFIVNSNDDGRASILVTNAMIENMGVTPEQLRADALENAPIIRPAVITGLNEVMMELMGPEMFQMMGLDQMPPEVMYVATVPDKVSGAGILAYQDFMDQAADKLGGDFYILPSSLHEILLVPDERGMEPAELKEMVKQVNATEVKPEEKLSDNVYHYDSKDHIFELAEKFEARQQEKEAGIDEKSEDRGSVIKELKDKKKEVDAKTPAKDVVAKAAKTKEETR